MANLLNALHLICAIVVLSEALNKIERTDIFDGRPGVFARLWRLAWLLVPWRWTRARVVTALKLTAWASLAIGAGGALIGPLLHFDKPSLQDVAVLAGFALLIVRSRLKEDRP